MKKIIMNKLKLTKNAGKLDDLSYFIYLSSLNKIKISLRDLAMDSLFKIWEINL